MAACPTCSGAKKRAGNRNRKQALTNNAHRDDPCTAFMEAYVLGHLVFLHQPDEDGPVLLRPLRLWLSRLFARLAR